jgi:hypothetical protein
MKSRVPERLIQFAVGGIAVFMMSATVVGAGDRLGLLPGWMDRSFTPYALLVFSIALGVGLLFCPKPLVERLGRFAAGFLTAFLAARIIAGVSQYLGVWIGKNNAGLVMYFTVPLAVATGMGAALWPRRWQDTRWGALAAVIAGVALGCLYALTIWRFFFGAFTSLAVQELSCWIAGGTCGLLAVAAGLRWKNVLAMVLVCTLAIVLPKPVFNTLAHQQQLTVAVVTADDASGAAKPPRARFFDRRDEEQAAVKRALEAVRAAGLKGEYQVTHLWRIGEGKPSLAVLLVKHGFAKREVFAEPDRATVVYVQGPAGWSMHPPDAKTLGRWIDVWPSFSPEDETATISIADADNIDLVDGVVEP